jgi:hypothetical protein
MQKIAFKGVELNDATKTRVMTYLESNYLFLDCKLYKELIDDAMGSARC